MGARMDERVRNAHAAAPTYTSAVVVIQPSVIIINITVYSQEDDDCNGFSDISDFKAPSVASDGPPDAADDVTIAGACGAGVETPSTKGFDIDGVTILPVFVDSLHRRYDSGIRRYLNYL